MQSTHLATVPFDCTYRSWSSFRVLPRAPLRKLDPAGYVPRLVPAPVTGNRRRRCTTACQHHRRAVRRILGCDVLQPDDRAQQQQRKHQRHNLYASFSGALLKKFLTSLLLCRFSRPRPRGQWAVPPTEHDLDLYQGNTRNHLRIYRLYDFPYYRWTRFPH